METITYCELCGNFEKTACIEYITTDNHGNRNKEFACKKCADELGLETEEGFEKRTRNWWRQHFKMRLGREPTDDEFDRFYVNRLN